MTPESLGTTRRSDTTTCLCGSEGGRPLPLESAVSRFPGPGQIVQCRHCGLRFVSPSPTAAELRAYYGGQFEETYRHAGIDYIGGSQALPLHMRRRLADLETRLGGTGVLVDVGVGGGAFAGHAKDRGWRVIGTEMSEAAARRAREQYGVETYVGEIRDLPTPSDSVHVVHMNHVLEHVIDPRQTLADAWRLLTPGGLLVVEVPHEFADLVYRARRTVGRVRAYEVPSPHLWFFTPATLARLIGAAGFVVESVETTRRDLAATSWVRAVVERVVHLLERPFRIGPLIVAVGRKRG